MAGKRKDSRGRVLKENERQRENGTYEFRFRDVGGIRRSLYAPTLEDLRKLEEKIARDKSDGIKVSANNVTLDDIYDLWKVVKKGLKDNTFSNYRYLYVQFISPKLGKEKVNKIKKSDVRRFYNGLAENDGLKLSTVESVHTVLSQILYLAVDDGYIRTNPSEGALRDLKSTHQYDSEKRKALTIEQQKVLESFLDENDTYRHWKPLITVMLYSGMRVGEVTGLRWCDIDLENGIIDINHTLVFYNKEHKATYAINSTKTPSSKRKIPMLEPVKKAFLEEKARQESLGIKCKTSVDGYSGFVFCNRFGEILNLGVINKALRRIMRDCNEEILENHKGKSEPVLLPRFSCHILRHTFATRLCEAGVHPKIVQAWLGHADVSTALNIYTDVTRDLELKAQNLMDAFFTGGVGCDTPKFTPDLPPLVGNL